MRFGVHQWPFPFGSPAIVLSGVLLGAAGTSMSYFHSRPSPYKEMNALGSVRSEAASQKTAELFVSRCARCHDEDGTGQTFRRKMPRLPDFTSVSFHTKRSRAALVSAILDGRGTQMPSFADRISTIEARALAEHVRTFAGVGAGDASTDADPDFYVRFRELQKEFDELRKQLRELKLRGR